MTRRTDETTTAIVEDESDTPLLPCAVNEDPKLVDRAARQIRDIVAQTMSQGLQDVGNYLLETFYENDVELYHSMKRSKHASLSLLEQRCETIDLPVSRSFLANAIGVAVLAKQLPRSSAFLKLPASHKQELLRAASPQKADLLATKALEKKLTVQKLRALVRRDSDKSKKDPAAGRKRKPAVLRVLGSCVRLMHDETQKRLVFRSADFKELTAEQAEEARALVDTLSKRLGEVADRLRD